MQFDGGSTLYPGGSNLHAGGSDRQQDPKWLANLGYCQAVAPRLEGSEQRQTVGMRIARRSSRRHTTAWLRRMSWQPHDSRISSRSLDFDVH